MTQTLLLVLPLLAVAGFAALARWERGRLLAREAFLRNAVGPPPSEVDAAIERHFNTLPTWLKGASND